MFAPLKVREVTLSNRVVLAVTSTGRAEEGLPNSTHGEQLLRRARGGAALAMTERTDHVIVCNGYKDEEFMRLALMGQKLGHQVFVVIEQLSEIDVLLQVAEPSRGAVAEYRQLNIECLRVLASFFRQNPTLEIEDACALDALIGHAVRLAYLEHHADREAVYNEYKAEAWAAFYASSPVRTSAFIVAALRSLLMLHDA